MRTVEASLTWPDGSLARAILQTVAPELGAPVRWDGDQEKIAALPSEIAPRAGGERCSVDTLLAYTEQHAAAVGASFAWGATGAYDTGAR